MCCQTCGDLFFSARLGDTVAYCISFLENVPHWLYLLGLSLRAPGNGLKLFVMLNVPENVIPSSSGPSKPGLP